MAVSVTADEILAARAGAGTCVGASVGVIVRVTMSVVVYGRTIMYDRRCRSSCELFCEYCHEYGWCSEHRYECGQEYETCIDCEFDYYICHICQRLCKDSSSKAVLGSASVGVSIRADESVAAGVIIEVSVAVISIVVLRDVVFEDIVMGVSVSGGVRAVRSVCADVNGAACLLSGMLAGVAPFLSIAEKFFYWN